MINDEPSAINKIDLRVLERDDENGDRSKVLFVRTDENKNVKLYFQVIRQGAMIKKGVLYFLDENPSVENKPIILLRDQVDAYWSQATEKLYFKKIGDVERVLPHLFEEKVQDLRQGLMAIKSPDYHYLRLNLDLDTIKSSLPRTKLARIDFLL
ncbi:hypothetical protein NHP22001_14230 [Helicobacter sp. NHP22-001]|nr:hypothetical protein NHP22001_14230 [Helicobacter sp. NHP22-001]